MSLIEALKHLKIPLKDIKKATKNFTTVIGKGGYGLVYKGELTLSGKLTIVAVKKLENDNNSGQGRKEFLTEIHLLSRYKHPNLVSLVGFCQEGKDKMLVYEYAEHGSLASYLQCTQPVCPLTWKQRINICIDAARGLDYLHNRVAPNQRIIHRDIKSANILLHHNFKAMVADLGLSIIARANESVTYVVTDPCGTSGYFDPVYYNTGILTKESDVYSFGVVLYEILCGRLCKLNVQSLTSNLIIDPHLNNHMNSDSMKEFLEIANHCLRDERKERPSMDLVLQKLEKALKLLETEEARELLELEGPSELQKHVETVQRQVSTSLLTEEACEKKFDEDKIEKSHVKNLSTSDIEMDNPLPSDYKQFIHYSDTNIVKKPQGDVKFPTKEEAYSILSTGILIKVSSKVNMWFWITKFTGKKCFVLSPTLLSYDKQLVKLKRITSKESRLGNVVHLSSSKTVGMRFEVPNGLFSTDTTYGCYLIYKMPQDFARETKVKIKIDNDDGNLMYLSISQSPEPESVESSMSKHKTIQMPRKRKDGWLEVNLGYKTGIQWMNMQYNDQFDHLRPRESTRRFWCILCPSHDNEFGNEADNKADNGTDQSFTLNPRYFSDINILMCSSDDVAQCPKLVVQGIEFRPV